MSHEIRTPLNSVIGFTELLENQVEISSHKKYLKSIKSSSNALLVIINDLLDLSKIEAGKMELVYNFMSLRSLVREISQIFSIQFDKKNLSFTTNLSPSLPDYVLLDEIRVRQILFNLVGNAVKFTKQGGVELSIQESDRKGDKHCIKIEVLDSGIGIPITQQKLIFEAFKQQVGQDTRTYGGTGLGLTISKKLVEAMNGTINVESKENEFTKFTILFKDVETASEIGTRSENNNKVQYDIKFKKSTIVLLDKDSFNRDLITEIFSGTDIKVISTNSGDDAIKAAINYNCSLILLDVNVKYDQAYNILNEIKNNEKIKKIPVIAMSTGIISIADSKFDDYVSKPIMQKDLLKVLRKYIKYTKQPKDIQNIVLNNNISMSDIYKHKNYTDIAKEIRALQRTWIQVTRNELSDDIEKFAQELSDLSKKYNIELISKYANKLKEHLASFDLLELSSCLKQFENISRTILDK